MADNNVSLTFNLVKIRTDQFALFEENHLDKGNVNLSTNMSFGLNVEEEAFSVSLKFTFEMKKKPFMATQVTCFFNIEKATWESLQSNDKIILPKGFVAHMAMLTVGTARGILHSKTEGTIFNKYILPTLNVAEMVPEDVVFD
ncbi:MULTISPECIES: hypothetical protein [unclassified Flavobacterium]|uniref:hypothetical protein n=1 Tax=unclassified Flavobacterium TaxID=196869 RepID=UPI00156D7E91|nr:MULTISPECIES: hypothetical protein [unclassified Flavobacterium]MBE0393165.1 hypothetical protein [Flavobacterium sp. PL002]NRT14180.1 hypothetical protein [Flavobacterium sp. 28A]